jgi:hypothetical protein
MGYNGTSIDLGFDVNANNLGNASQPFSAFAGSSGKIDLIKSNGAITGATIDVAFSSYHQSSMFLAIGPDGDSVSYTYAGLFGVVPKVKESACFLVVGGTGIEPVTPAV